ncbi:MAG: transposase [Actinomycetota bacterium]|nr:transposase [Actinomycetota bacterium]
MRCYGASLSPSAPTGRRGESFFGQLPGSPTFITADRDQATLNAIASTWPGAKVYPCAHHLRANVEAILKKGGLFDRRRAIVGARHERTFIDPAAYVAFRAVAHRYLAADLSRASARQQEATVKLARWLTNNEDAIVRSLVE